ncbi:cytochrome P450 [Trametes meyenii]|nr:cytochrome P450 [Trametes meyenii]
MMSPLLQALAISVATWILFKTLRRFIVKTDLDNIPGPESPSFLYGHLEQLYDRQGWAFHRGLGEKFGSVVRLRGKFGQDILYTFDPKAMHHIVVKDQDIFEQATWFLRRVMIYYVFGEGLVATLGDHHRRQRKLLNPIFSTNHMRHMTPIFYRVCHRLGSAIESRVRSADSADVPGEYTSNKPAEIDIANWMGRTALELIGQAGLGYSFDPLTEDTSDEFATAMKELIPVTSQTSSAKQYIPVFEAIVPWSWRRTVVKLLPSPALKKIIATSDTLWHQSTEIYTQKKEALMSGDEAVKQQVGEGKDLISLLLRVNVEAAQEDKLPEDELIGQVATLTFAAMDTTSNALSLTLWRLAQNVDVQNKLRQEILSAQEAAGGDIAYDDLVSLPYLDAICRETLRLHVPAPLRFRETRKDVMLPLSKPVHGLDGRSIREILVPKGTPVFVGVEAANTNKTYWGADAYEWKPERWLQPLPESVLDAKIPGVYANLMTFWGGGRACIGFKFSQLEMKVVLAVLISKFTFELPRDKQIYWNLTEIVYPSMDTKGECPSMTLQVGLVTK